MKEKISARLKILEENGVKYTLAEHPAVYTIEEVMSLNLPNRRDIAKNLFLRDRRGTAYYIVTMREGKRANLKSLRQKLNSRPLTFASREELQGKLCLEKGSVTPLGVLDNRERDVKVIIDESFKNRLIGVHPNDNTATIWLDCADLEKIIALHGNSAEYIEI